MAVSGRPVDRIIGDLDSLTNLEVWRESGTEIVQVDDQDTTDFEKCVNRITCDPIIGLGFLGGRLDHELAVLDTLIANPGRSIVLIGSEDAVIHCPREISLDLPIGSRLSLYPFRDVTGRKSEGLRWSIEGLSFSPGRKIGTSNEVTGPVRLGVEGEGLVLMVPRADWQSLLRGLVEACSRARTETVPT